MRFLEEFHPRINLSTNSSSSSSSSWHENVTTLHDNRWKLLWIIVTTTLIVFTVTGNAVTLYAVCKIKSFQSSISNLYISSLAAADIIVGGFVMTFMMLYTIAYDGRWVFGRTMCDFWQATDFISCTISLYSICAIGFDRWLNLEKPLRIFKRNKIVAKKAIVAVWMLPVLVWAPILTLVRAYNEESRLVDDDQKCSFPWKPKFLIPLVAVVTFYLPVFTLIILFVRITAVIRSHFAFLHQHSNQNLLDAENKSNNNNGRYSSDRSPSVTPTPERRPRNGAAGGGSPRGRSIPPKLSIIPQDDSSKDNQTLGGAGDYCGSNPLLTPTPSEPSPRQLSIIRSPSPSTLTPTNSGNQSPLAVLLLRERLSPSAKDAGSHFVLPVPPSPCGSVSPEASPSRRRSSRIGGFFTEMTPLLSPRLSSESSCRRNSVYKRSASHESIDEEKSDKSASPVDPGDQKRSSVTSDTAVFFTKRVLARKPQLQRAQTDLFIEVPLGVPGGNLNNRNGRMHVRRGTRFSVVSLTTSLTNLGRRCSLNIFSELLPCPASFSQQIRAAKAVGLIMIFFLVCWIPFLILWPLKAYCNECVPDNVYNLAIWANYLNSSLNPVLYTLCSPRFQNYFKDSCSRCKCCFPKTKDCTKTLLL